jgi:hypothetical protein
MRTAAAGRLGPALVRGGAGVGKTRLLAEVAEVARLQGAVVASTQCFGTSGRLEGSLALDAEGAYVDATRLCVTPTQVLGCHDEGRLVSQSVTQVVQLAAQVGQRLCVGRVRPERFGDALPGLG